MCLSHTNMHFKGVSLAKMQPSIYVVWQWTFWSRTAWLFDKSAGQPQFKSHLMGEYQLHFFQSGGCCILLDWVTNLQHVFIQKEAFKTLFRTLVHVSFM